MRLWWSVTRGLGIAFVGVRFRYMAHSPGTLGGHCRWATVRREYVLPADVIREGGRRLDGTLGGFGT
jgi:hypothetical protein